MRERAHKKGMGWGHEALGWDRESERGDRDWRGATSTQSEGGGAWKEVGGGRGGGAAETLRLRGRDRSLRVRRGQNPGEGDRDSKRAGEETRTERREPTEKAGNPKSEG